MLNYWNLVDKNFVRASKMLQKIKNKDIVRFTKACERLAKVIEDIQEYNPDAHLYCNMDELELHGYRYEYDDDFHNAEAVASVYVSGTNCGER